MEPNPGDVTGIADSIGEGSRRVTAQDVEAARAKEEEASTALLDAMEASVEQQGQWFVPVGEKKPITETRDVEQKRGFLGRKTETVPVEQTVGHEDTRAFIMKAPFEHKVYGQPRTDFIVVIPKGIFSAQFYDSEINKDHPGEGGTRYDREYQLVKGLAEGTLKLDPEESRYIPERGQQRDILQLVARDVYGKYIPSVELHLNRASQRYESEPEFDSQALKGVIEASIAKTETPHKANFERAQEDVQLAQDAAGLIPSLPPRQ